RHARDAWPGRGLALGRVVNPTALVGDTSAACGTAPHRSAPGWSSRSRLMPCEPLDALKNLTKEVPRQVAFGKLQGEVPGMPDEAVLNSRCWRLVRDQLWMATGKTSRVGAVDSAKALTVGT